MKVEHSFGYFPALRGNFQVIGDMDSFNNENIAIFFDFAPRFGSQITLSCGNLASFQRASGVWQFK